MMKKLLTFVALMCCGFTSCSKAVEPPAVDGKTVVTSFFLKEVEMTVLTKLGDGVSSLKDVRKKYGTNLLVATNGGIFEGDFKTSGLLVTNSKEVYPLNTNQGSGNFYLMPNGVFSVVGGKPQIQETGAYAKANHQPSLAIQSGPLLLLNGKVHEKFTAGSKHRYTRNGIGVDAEGRVFIAYFGEPCSLHAMAEYFKKTLKCHSALYLDGAISGVLTADRAVRLEHNYASIIVVRALK